MFCPLTADTRIPCARDGLQSNDTNLVDRSELLKRGKWDNNPNDCAVRVTNEKTLFKIKMLTLCWYYLGVSYIDCRDHKRNRGCQSMVFCIGEDSKVSFKERHLYFTRYVRIETGEDDVTV